MPSETEGFERSSKTLSSSTRSKQEDDEDKKCQDWLAASDGWHEFERWQDGVGPVRLDWGLERFALASGHSD